MSELETEHSSNRRRIRAIVLIVIGAGLGIPGERFIVRSNSEVVPGVERTRLVAPPPFSRVGNRIVVPPGSLLRSQLVVEGAATKEMARELVLPAVVEADPARTVNVMPPVTGVVVDLMAQLGGRVVKGEQLAVIDSSDLAQAISDEEKARSAPKLTKQTLDRLLIL